MREGLGSGSLSESLALNIIKVLGCPAGSDRNEWVSWFRIYVWDVNNLLL